MTRLPNMRRAGLTPFREAAKAGPMELGSAVSTGAGRLPFRGIIHVAGIDMLSRASVGSVQESVRGAMRIIQENVFDSVAFPVIGAGSGSLSPERALEVMLETFGTIESFARVVVVLYPKAA